MGALGYQQSNLNQDYGSGRAAFTIYELAMREFEAVVSRRRFCRSIQSTLASGLFYISAGDDLSRRPPPALAAADQMDQMDAWANETNGLAVFNQSNDVHHILTKLSVISLTHMVDVRLVIAMISASVAPVAESVDAADSKSVACEGVPVRVRPGAPMIGMYGMRGSGPKNLIAGGVLFSLVSCASPVLAGPAIVIEPVSGVVLYSEDADRQWHPASLTKLMTAYLVLEAVRDGRLSLSDTIRCSPHAASQQPSKMGLPVGATLTVDDGLKALIIKSANDVAVMLAERVGGDEAAFVVKMNETAKRLGMNRTLFFNANGLPNDQQVTSARDMALLARALLKEFPEFTYIYALPEATVGKYVVRTHNELLRGFEGADGMKTGFVCSSGYNVVASATRDGQKVVAVVLGESSGASRRARAAALMEHGFEQYKWKALFSTTIDAMGLDVPANAGPGDLHNVVCTGHRPARRHRGRHNRKHKRKAPAHRRHARKAEAAVTPPTAGHPARRQQ
jgi:D-alanyl-D-alanine carboxypeptidase